MIRRDWPRGAESPERWLLISQPDHAVLSRQLAEAWGSDAVEPLVCPPDEPNHPLAAVRREVLAAIEHHDDGWIGWSDDPTIDTDSGKPLAFTEMPTAEAQRLWTDSITACRTIGPLAGWMVASHFSALQSKRDGDYPEWIDWLAGVNAERTAWLGEWLAASEHHTEKLANRCLAWLQTLDWISLWLCCRCPTQPGDMPVEPLEVGGDETGWPKITFTPKVSITGEHVVQPTPWPFMRSELLLGVTSSSIPTGRYQPDEITSAAESITLRWRIAS